MINIIQKDVTHPIHRNQVLLINFAEYMYREITGRSDYSMQELVKIVNGYSDILKLNKYYDTFTIDFANYCSSQSWDKTSATLGINNEGKNIAKTTAELLEDFKQII